MRSCLKIKTPNKDTEFSYLERTNKNCFYSAFRSLWRRKVFANGHRGNSVFSNGSHRPSLSVWALQSAGFLANSEIQKPSPALQKRAPESSAQDSILWNTARPLEGDSEVLVLQCDFLFVFVYKVIILKMLSSKSRALNRVHGAHENVPSKPTLQLCSSISLGSIWRPLT